MSIKTSRALQFRENLAERIFVADGAMGTMLYSRGVFINRCFDELNLTAPAMIAEIHREYAAVGAEILETNTFGANRTRLAGFGLADKIVAINEAGVRLAHEAASEGIYVAGAMGPLGVHLQPLGAMALREARDVFREHAQALCNAGVDLLVLETFTDLAELREAVLAAREAAGDEMVIVAQVAIGDAGELPGGASALDFVREANDWPVDVLGFNCSVGPKTVLEALEEVAPHSLKPLSASPNAGLPVRVDGRNIYLSSPEYMAQYSRRLLQAGARIIGGCCGTTPGHIKEMVSETRSLQPRQASLQHKARATVRVDPKSAPPEPQRVAVPLREKSKLGTKLADGRFVSFVEILPPRGTDATREIAGAALCAAHGIDCINVPDGPRASARLSAQAACQLIQQHAGIETAVHFCCRDRNILGIQSELLAAHALGVRNLICITGDPPRMGVYPEATAVFDVDAIGLVRIAHNLNRGLDIGGGAMGSQTALVIGVGANPGAINLDEEIHRFERKVEAGAEYVVTQPVFDLALLEEFLRRIKGFKIPVICGIWPLISYRNAEFMVNELRVPVPERFMERMRRADNAEKASQAGVAIAREMVEQVQLMVEGVQLSAPFARYQLALDVASAIRVEEGILA
jgi:methionine synthase I (cobalamin-dependent)/5,10-methylenetetrahydrofolate reductase